MCLKPFLFSQAYVRLQKAIKSVGGGEEEAVEHWESRENENMYEII